MSVFVVIGGGVLLSVVACVIVCGYNLARLLNPAPSPAPSPSVEAIAVLRSVAKIPALANFQVKWIGPALVMINATTVRAHTEEGTATNSEAQPVACISIGGAGGELIKVSKFAKGNLVPARTMQAEIDSDQQIPTITTAIVNFLDLSN